VKEMGAALLVEQIWISTVGGIAVIGDPSGSRIAVAKRMSPTAD
jgi:hypothetical protein